MNRLIATNSVPFSGRDVAPSSGTPQYATDGVPGVTPPTTWPAYAFNMIQDEIMAVLAAAGVTPDDTNWGQLLQSLRTLFGGTGSLSNPAYMRLSGNLIVEMGSANAPNTGGSSTAATVIFPLTFPTGVFAVVGAAQGAGNSSTLGYPAFSALSLSDSSFLAKLDMLGWATVNQAVPFSWIALGF